MRLCKTKMEIIMAKHDMYQKDLADKVGTVSYTHLDVYKRKVLLERHIKSCVVDDIRRGDSDATVEELCRTLQKMMK